MTPQKRPPKLSPEDRLFVENMKSERVRLELSQDALAEKVAEHGVPEFNQMALSRIEAGTRQLGLGEARAIAAALDGSVEEMLQPSSEYSLYQTLRTFMDRETHANDQLAGYLAVVQREIQLVRNALEGFEESDWRNVLTGSALETAEKRVRMARLTVEDGLDGAIMRARQKFSSPG